MRRDVSSLDGSLSVQTESAKPSPKTGEGAVCSRWVRCGRPTCRCMRNGSKHGSYYARYWWQDGRRFKRYVRQHDAADVAAACATRREAERSEREQADEARQAWREIRALIRGIERDER